MNKIIIFLLLSFSIVSAESINGLANIRTIPNGKIQLELFDSTYVYAYELENNWFKILLTAFVLKSDIDNSGILKKGAILYNSDLIHEKGITKDYIDINSLWQESDNPEYIEIRVYGYTFKENIYSNSIIEREIERVINSKNYKELFEVFNRFGFSEYELEGYNVYTFYDGAEPWAGNDFRIIVYFTSNNELIGLANTGRKINIDYLEKGKIDRNFNMYYLKLLHSSEKINFENYVSDYFSSRD